jgi:2-polyprenyl-6-methoxyphenol hydroxylase-like FAD-dependent oxidoreductase
MAAGAFDVLVVGGGPAGCAAAITMARAGLRVALADRPRALPPGEALAPAGVGLLRELEVWDAFCAGPHTPCHAYRAAWGSSAPTYMDLVRGPYGPAWMLDRAALVSALRTRALACNAIPLHVADRLPIERRDGNWFVGAQLDVLARFIVDASGRAGAVVRRLGIRRVTDGRQIAFVAVLQNERGRDEAPLMVEAVADGWWYSAATSAGETVIAYFTDRDLIDLRAARKSPEFAALLGRTHATAERVARTGAAFTAPVRVVAAHDAFLDTVWGDGWVAAGDASITYDPLSGHGITAALASGRDAGHAVVAKLSGDDAALRRYGVSQSRVRREYRARRAEQYMAETRWSDRPFWARRFAASGEGSSLRASQ